MTTSNDYTKARKGEGYPGILLWLGGEGGTLQILLRELVFYITHPWPCRKDINSVANLKRFHLPAVQLTSWLCSSLDRHWLLYPSHTTNHQVSSFVLPLWDSHNQPVTGGGYALGLLIHLSQDASITVIDITRIPFSLPVDIPTWPGFQIIATVFIKMLFLGEALTTMIVYVWCRRNPYVRYNFFGLFNFQAPYLPWILVLFSVLFGGSVLVDLVGKYPVATTTLSQ